MGIWPIKVVKSFEERFEDVEATYDQLVNNTYTFPDGTIYEGSWDFIPLKATYTKNGQTIRKQAFETPIKDLLDEDLIVGAMFSILRPGVEITPHSGHKGFAEYIYKAHICIHEAENSALVVEGKKHTWERGKGFLFDDTKQHIANNRGKDTRVVLLLDIARDPSYIPTMSENSVEQFKELL